ncbi:hypothetical protein FRB99_004741 [Tulasnella sp. 403]|nr:hypothetical protein FRB99_004741 [Tulasnella sp. 403]
MAKPANLPTLHPLPRHECFVLVPSLPLRQTKGQGGTTKPTTLAPKQVPQLGAEWGPVLTPIRNTYEAAAKDAAKATSTASKRKAMEFLDHESLGRGKRNLSQKAGDPHNAVFN